MEDELMRPKTSRRQASDTSLENGNWSLREEKVCWSIMRIRKLGNIVILAEWTRSDGKKRRLVLGPYWHFLVFTVVIISSVSTMIYAIVIPYDYKVERVIGVTLTILTISSLLCTALSDPGIFPRYVKPLGQNWTYSEYAQSYRPPGVIYCQHCRVLIEDYNRIHFCPWSGIVIGKGNEVFFQVFVSSIILALTFNVVVVSLSLHHKGF